MSDTGWVILENIVLYTLAAVCLFFLPEWWKLCGLFFLAFTNVGVKKR